MVKGEMDSIKSVIGGGSAGISAVLAGQPFDTIKVRLQTSNQYKGTMDCVRQLVAKEGVRGLYKGMSAPLLGVTPMFALSFWAYDQSVHLVRAASTKKGEKPARELTIAQYGIAGALSAIPTTLITTPMERVKVVMQTQDQVVGGKKYTGMFDAARGMHAEGGVASLYRGTIATLARDIPGSAMYFLGYEYVVRLLRPADGTLSIGAELFAGGMAGVAMWSTAIPSDVIKSRIQASPQGTYKGFVDCALQIFKHEGPSALFKGIGPALLRAFPANAAAFLGRAAALHMCHKLW